jgi:hypothetical protein
MPIHGTLEGIGEDLVYRPHPDFAGVEGFTFIVRDAADVSEAAFGSTDEGGAVRPPSIARARDAAQTSSSTRSVTIVDCRSSTTGTPFVPPLRDEKP